MIHYIRHHIRCTGECGYCKQLLKENPGKTMEEIKKKEDEESLFTWDEPSCII